jgi:SAM-dependent methyltransferase
VGSAKIQANYWGQDASGWAVYFEPHFKPLWLVMLDRLVVRSGTRFLDVGCGAGGACAIAAERQASVTGLDAAPEFIDIARMRVHTAKFDVGDIEALPYKDDEFDAVFAANVLPFADEPEFALAECKRVCAIDGRIAIGAWTARNMQAVISQARDAQLPVGTPLEHLDLTVPGTLEKLAARCGLSIVSDEEVFCPFDYDNFDTFWRGQRAVGNAQVAIAAIGEDNVKEGLHEIYTQLQSEDGSIRIENWLRCVCLKNKN